MLLCVFFTQTQAYKLHHAIGLTLFSSEVNIRVEITKITETLEVEKFNG